MESIIITAIVSLVQAGVKLAAEAGHPVDLQKIMATAAAKAGASMAEYNRQLEEQRKLFPQG
jgi:hypothetical protein